ncbi:hypothetical protein LzC2_34090 [Planctomycetes bacterium LzC2]|uniref:PASTA domain-containing protein n=2 Tax=Alienimonas chondri TaxID=2681879 RepID=A0ABX1VHJ2_9PLAN|nr:hypothetical protein [Alienimonas chondri]
MGVACLVVGAGVVTAQERTAEQRPAPQAMRVDTLSPTLEATLQAWYDATKGIEKLEGRHTQVESDDTFRSEKHSAGQFFYEGPDKGRIDMGPRPANQCRPRARQGMNPYKVVPGEVTQWVCNGVDLKQVDVAKKEVTVTPIPPQHRGKNIMNGPLPFLLGMPPEVVKQRFKISFPGAQFEPKGDIRTWLADPKSTVMLRVIPLLAQDAQNWKEALVVLSKPDFLPVRIKLYAPGGEGDTVYEFSDLKVNHNPLIPIFTKDPFEPNLAGYNLINLNLNGGGPEQGPSVAPVALPQTVPSVVGFDHAQAEKVLLARRYQVKKFPGEQTNDKEFVGKVQAQQYPAGEKLPAGKVVGLKIWMAAPGIRPASASRPVSP